MCPVGRRNARTLLKLTYSVLKTPRARRYEYYDSPLTSAQQAADYCERRGGRGRGGRRTDGAGLAWITSPTEEAFIKSTVMNGDT